MRDLVDLAIFDRFWGAFRLWRVIKSRGEVNIRYCSREHSATWNLKFMRRYKLRGTSYYFILMQSIFRNLKLMRYYKSREGSYESGLLLSVF